MSKEQAYSLFSQANENFRRANSTKDSEQAERLYEKAILAFEKITNEGQIKNAKLYYNLANAYFLKSELSGKGELGRAVLNYRRAEELDGSDANIQKNLAFARSRRIDTIVVKTEKRILQTLFFWHYDFAIKSRFLLACVFFAIVCISITIMIFRGQGAAGMVTAVICGILMICFSASVVTETGIQADRVCGVIIADSVVGRQGDGRNYPVSFKESLHAGTEFDLLEHRGGWLHIKLSDNSDSWIPETTADLI